MSRHEPYISTVTLTDLNPFLRPTAKDTTPRTDGQRLGFALKSIPLWDLTVFLLRGLFALFFASIAYVLLWWLFTVMFFGSIGGLMHSVTLLFYGLMP